MWIKTNCGEFLNIGISDHRICLLQNLTQVKKQQLEPDMEQGTSSKLGKEYIKTVYCHHAYFNLYAEYIMQNPQLDEAQAGIKIAGRNNSNLRYAEDTTLMAENEEKLKNLLMKVKEESEKAGLKLNTQK